jgi:hypothetical protein
MRADGDVIPEVVAQAALVIHQFTNQSKKRGAFVAFATDSIRLDRERFSSQRAGSLPFENSMCEMASKWSRVATCRLAA